MNFEKQFGKIFAGNVRSKPEKDTPIEQDLVASIYSHIAGDKESVIDKEQSSILSDLLKGEHYNDFILPPNVPSVYRGMGLTKEQLVRMLESVYGDSIAARKALNIREGKVENVNFVYKPLPTQDASSWTTDFNTAFDFAKFVNNNDVIIILTADVGTNSNKFFDLTQWYKEVDGNRRDEKEAIGLGNIIVNKIEWLIR